MTLDEDRSPSTLAKGKGLTMFCLSGTEAQSTAPAAVSTDCPPKSFLSSSLLDWHAHPVNFKESDPTHNSREYTRMGLNHAPCQCWVYVWSCDAILANGTSGETAKGREVMRKQFCKTFYLMIKKKLKEEIVSFSTKTLICVCECWARRGLAAAMRMAEQNREKNPDL